LRVIRVALFKGGKPIRAVLRWQLCATVVAALIAAAWQGSHGAYSALLGGFINVAAGAVFGWVAARGDNSSAGETLHALFRAEASKVILIVAQLWLVLTVYKEIMLAAFFGTFFLTVILFTMAFFARER
jgi:ATP synthase protein I